MPGLTPVETTIAVLVVILIGVSKAGFAGGTGVLATPLFCLVTDAHRAVAILLPVLCACDWVSFWYYRRSFEWRPLLLCLPGALLGIAAGGLLLGRVDSDDLAVIVGVIALLFVAHRGAQALRGGSSTAWRPARWSGSLFGGAAGFFSTLAHAAGPIMAAYLLPQNLGRRLYVGTTVVFFVMVNHVKLVPYGLQGKLRFDNLKLSLILLPVVPVGVWLGVWLNRRMSERVFLTVVYVLLLLSGLRLTGVPTPLDLLVGALREP